MADGTKIEWTDATWNPIVGCSVVSPGCTNCYAMRLDEKALSQPLRWRRPRKIFVCAHSDLFHEATPDEWIDRVFAVMALCPQHTFQVLTKRPKRMRDYFSTCPPALRRAAVIDRMYEIMRAEHRGYFTAIAWPLPNVWLGVTAEDKTRADERIPDLLATPAAKRFVSVEPMLGALNLRRIRIAPNHHTIIDALEGYALTEKSSWSGSGCEHTKLDWVICGSESGPGARPMHPDWARSLRDQCAAAGVPFFMKQWGEWIPALDRDNNDPDWRADYSREFDDRHPHKWLNLAGGCGFHGERFHVMRRVGKRASGRLLDGVEHLAFPET